MMFVALLLCAIALLVVPLLAVAHLLSQRGVSFRVDVQIPGPEGAPHPPPRQRTHTRAAPRAQGIPRNGPPPTDTWEPEPPPRRHPSMNPFQVISALVGLATLAGIFVTLGRLLAKVESIDERQRELMDPKTGLVALLRGRTHELANADTALGNALKLLEQRFDLHVKESEAEHRRLLGEVGRLERAVERLSERSSGAGS